MTKIENHPARFFQLDQVPEPRGELEAIFASGECRPVNKWVHYLAIYERHLAPLRGSAVRLLEIGVKYGGSLDMWRRYLGGKATIYGIDVKPACRNRVSPPNQVRIGSQADGEFLRGVVEEMGGIDVVIDDGSHEGADQKASFDALFPLLSENGLYVIEDLQTSYWGELYDVGEDGSQTGIGLLTQLMEDLHGWYHDDAQRDFAREWVYGLHVYDGIAVIEKQRRERPGHIVVKRKDAGTA